MDALRLTQNRSASSGNSSLSRPRPGEAAAEPGGRKTILLFSEGLQVPPALEHVLRTAISEAIEPTQRLCGGRAGMGRHAQLEATREALAQAAWRASADDDVERAGHANRFSHRTAERPCAWTARAHSPTSVGTGGLLMPTATTFEAAANGRSATFAVYELVYEPKNQTLTSVSEDRGEVRRAGLGCRPQRLLRDPLRRGRGDVPTRWTCFAPEGGAGPRRLPIKWASSDSGRRHRLSATQRCWIPLAEIAFEETVAATWTCPLRADAVLRDAAGSVVEKSARTLRSSCSVATGGAQAGERLFLTLLHLAPGRYTVEAAVVDQLGRHRSVQRSALNVGARDPGHAVTWPSSSRELYPRALCAAKIFPAREERVVRS